MLADLAQRHELSHARENFVERDHDLRRPHAIFFQRHELDEAHEHAFFAREAAEGGDLVVIEAAQQNAIDLHRIQPGALRGANSCQHALVGVGHAGDAGEALGIDRIHRNRDARKAGVGQRLRQLGQQMSVGGEGDVERLAFERLHAGQLAHHVDQAAAQQRLAAGETDLGDAQADEDTRHAQVVGDGHLRKLRPVAARAAIDALVVAAIGDGDPQIADAPAVFVG